jgi:hypothetical protein
MGAALIQLGLRERKKLGVFHFFVTIAAFQFCFGYVFVVLTTKVLMPLMYTLPLFSAK